MTNTQLYKNKNMYKTINNITHSNSDSLIKNKIALRITLFNIACNFILFIIKYTTSIFGGSTSMKADAFHSLSDVFVSLIVLAGIKISNKDIDQKMPYGYDRIECIAAIILSFILCDVGLIIGYNAITDIFNGKYGNEITSKIITLIISIISITAKIVMFFVTLIIANKMNLGTLKADAWHQLSDALSSVGVFIGVIGTIVGIKFADKIASILVCLILIKISIGIFIDSVKKVIDHSAPDYIIFQIKKILQNHLEFKDYKVKTRMFGNYIIAHIEIKNYSNDSILSFKNKCNELIYTIKCSIPEIKNCIISIK